MRIRGQRGTLPAMAMSLEYARPITWGELKNCDRVRDIERSKSRKRGKKKAERQRQRQRESQRYLRNKMDELRCLQRVCRFDILAITESHLDSSVPDGSLHIDGLKLLRLDRIGGGCVLYYAEHLNAIQRKYLFTEGIEAI